ncbi:2851_t:CDS:1, partial [Paraglomus occultum]
RRYRFLIRIILPLIGVYLLYLIAYRPENWISDTYPGLASPSHGSDVNWLERQQQVRKAFQHAWSAYVRDAWGCDEYHPISRRGSNLTTQGIGFTIVDSLDTLFLMNLTDEFRRARNWVAKELDFDIDGEVNLFETTIRVFGGLLSAYNLSGDMEFLSKAVDLADRLLGAFLSPTAIPYASVNLRRKSGVEAHFASGASSTSEVTTLQLEFKYLSHLTGDEKYWKKVEETIFKIDSLERLDGL